MRLLISEFICGGGLANHALPATLKQEGMMMLKALISDCLRIDNCEIVTTLDPRIQLTDSNIEVIPVTASKDYIQQIQANAANADMVWIVAPESEGVLASTVHKLQVANCIVLNSSVEAIVRTGDKYICTKALDSAGLPVIQHLKYETLVDYSDKVVLKPRLGAGGESLRICESGALATRHIDDPEQWIIQPYIQGEHRSMSILCWRGQACILSCNIQQLENFPEPRLKKCIVNAFPATSELHSLANRIANVFPGLSGYVGVDYIETECGMVIVEINPRLTTSYIGLAKALVQNPAQLCIDVNLHKSLPNEISNTGISTEVAIA